MNLVSKISFPLIHKRSSLPTFAVIFGIIGSVPILMVMWVALCSQFTRVEGTNNTSLYNIYVCIRAIFAVTMIASLAVYNLKRISYALIPASVLGFITAVINEIIAVSNYTDKKALADSMSMHPSYTQNFIDIAEASLLLILSVLFLLYLFGVFKTTFPIIFSSIIAIIFMIYSIISYSTTYETSFYTILCRSYAIPIAISTLLFSFASKTKRQLGRVDRPEPRRMQA